MIVKIRKLDFSLKGKNLETIIISKRFSNNFKIYTEEDDQNDPKLYPFLISFKTGFLTRKDPILTLPSRFSALDNLLLKMRWNQPDGSKGLLAKNTFAETTKNELPELCVDDIEDSMLILALFRDYSFITSAYLLEGCHHNYLKSGTYGLGRDVLPSNISKPFKKLSDKLELRPFMEYNSCYALNNYYRKDSSKGLLINNIDIHRSFINIKSEAGFILVHIAINNYGWMLLKSGIKLLESCRKKDRFDFIENLNGVIAAMSFINREFERMYFESNSEDYNIFRTFIMGITNQPMFPRGVVYEGCYDEKPQFFRGESGANDSIIPFVDNLLQITGYLPHNQLTEILRDFRSYRPKTHKEFLTWTEKEAKMVGILEYAREDNHSLFKLILAADLVREFRFRHWTLTRMYIMDKSKHPVATGGSPITTWLSNGLLTVIDFILNNSKLIKEQELKSNEKFTLDSIIKRCQLEKTIIIEETEERRKLYGQ